MRGVCHVLSPPHGATLGEVEALLLPLLTRGRILAIGRLDDRMVVEFSAPEDAADVVGTHRLRGAAVAVELADAADPDGDDDPGEDDDGMSRSESRRDKEKRMNRVGLSYRCSRCGQPKKGHVCLLEDGGAPVHRVNSDYPARAPGLTPADLHTGRASPPSTGWDLQSETLFEEN